MSSYMALHAMIGARAAVIVCGVFSTCVALATLIGYQLAIVGLYQWGSAAIGMAPNTALGILLTGIGVTVLGSSNQVWRCS